MIRKKHQAVLIGLILLLPGSQLVSQNVIITNDTTKTPEVRLGEVVIKASKDQLQLKEMPASVSLISAKEIEQNEIETLTSLTGTVPNLFMPDYGSKLTSPIYIRGIGSRIGEPAVGLYVDDIPYFEKSSHNFDFFDLESIEVLRGPQGTLFGRNTRGGIINVSTLSPMDFQGLKAQASAGTYGKYNLRAGYYGKSGDFGYSASLNYRKQAGYFENTYLNEMFDPMTSLGGRLRLVYDVSKHLRIENVLSSEMSDEGAYPYALYNSAKDSLSKAGYDHPSAYNRSMISDALVINYKSNKMKLKSVTAYQYMDDLQDIDQDFTPASLFSVTQDQILNQLSQELILQSPEKKAFNWLFGASGFLQMVDREVDVTYGEDGVTKYKLPGAYSYLKKYDKSVQGAAFFGQVRADDFLIDNLSATLGIRGDYEKASLNYVYTTNVMGNISTKADTIYPSMDDFVILPKVALDYRVGKTNLYATVVSGYKTGGFNSTFERPEDLTYKPEYSLNYELGLKTSVFDNQIYIDAALFYIDMKDQQIYQTVPSGKGSMLKNAGESLSQGGELTLKAIPVCGFETAINYGYTHATFTKHFVNETTDYSGNFIPYAPMHTVSFNINKTFEIKHSNLLDKVKLNLLYRGAGDTYWKEDNDVKEPYFDMVDAKLSFIKGDFQFDLIGSNLLNKQYHTFYFTALGNEYVQLSKPQWFGINLSYNL